MPAIIHDLTRPDGDNPADHSADYSAALSYLYGRINYEKIGAAPYTLSYYRLDRMRKLLEILGNPHQRYSIVHVAGTKGKGTTATLLADSLRACGKRTGLYTSPHLLRLEERINYEGRSCTAAQLVGLTAAVRLAADELESGGGERATFFELTTAMGFLHFAQQGAEAVVLEVGLGGRLDSTNVCSPAVSVVTSISLDHQAQLGNTLDSIAREKAGIVKPHIPVVCVTRAPEARAAIIEVAAAQQAPLHLIDRDFHVDWSPLLPLPNTQQVADQDSLLRLRAELTYQSLNVARRSAVASLPPHHTPTAEAETTPSSNSEQPPSGFEGRWQTRLLGRHQADNIAAVLATLNVLQQQGWKLPRAQVQRAIATTQPLARLEIVSCSPLSIIDSAHNPASITAGLETLADHFPARDLTIVFAASRDKDWSRMLELLGARASRLVLTAYRENPRALPLVELQQRAEQLQHIWSRSRHAAVPIETVDTPAAAWAHARRIAPAESIVYATGSFFLAAEIMSSLVSVGS
ncbi:MAG: bifunctional folylpolyglutamate synthase/dihydrofolate synthase [Planctomycetales bacterium]|nr:bifunctional folylpolyglutamate synthase/dihydrofolate synthase [Planctomycetales bacterium]